MTPEQNKFLLRLRDSGVTNMMGAGPYIEIKFGVDARTARGILADWIRSFEPGGINDPNRGDES